MEIDKITFQRFLDDPEFMEAEASKMPQTQRVQTFIEVGEELLVRFEELGSIADLERSTGLMEQAVDFIDDDNRADMYNNLGNALRMLFRQTRSVNDLARAINAHNRAVLLTPKYDPDRGVYLNQLGIALETKFDQTGSLDDLNRCISIKEEAVALTPEHNPNSPLYLNNLGNALQNRFVHLGANNDLEHAIELQTKALELTQKTKTRSLAIRLKNLGIAFQLKFEQTGSMDDINRAIDLQDQAVQLTPKEDPNLPLFLNSLGNSLQRKVERTDSMNDLAREIEMIEMAIALTPQNDPSLPARLNSLSNALSQKFRRTGAIIELDRAIALNERAVAVTNMENPNFAIYLNNLGGALQTRFERLGSMDDIDRGVVVSEQAVLLTPNNHPAIESHLNTLGIALHSRFVRNGMMNDINRAIAIKERTVECSGASHPVQALRFNNLGMALLLRYGRIGEIGDLDRAIVVEKQAVDLTAKDHPFLPMYLNNLGNSLHCRFLLHNEMSDLQNAINTANQAVALTSEYHPDRALYLYNYGNALQSRFAISGSMDDLEQAIIANERALSIFTAPPLIRIQAADTAQQLLGDNFQRANPLLRIAIELLPLVSPRSLRQSDQQYNISQVAGITSRAISVFLECNEKPEDVLQLLELGRGALAALRLEIRLDISTLKTGHPQLAQEYEDVRLQIDCLEDPDIDRRRILSQKFENMVSDIRRLEGFDRFLLGPSVDELMQLASWGPIIIFNVSDIRSDAFLVQTSGVRLLPLPLLSSGELELNTLDFVEAVRDINLKTYHKAKTRVQKVLEWLWDVAVSPILVALGFTRQPSDQEAWPRVWWVASGFLNLLPLHAAGYHESSLVPPQTTLDRVISSYSPTVKALAYAYEKVRNSDPKTDQKLLLVGMSKTPKCRDLPFVDQELKFLMTLTPSRRQTTIIRDPTRQSVMTEILNHGIVHLACHSESAIDPSQSRFLLSDWETSPLTVVDLTSLNIQFPRLAYLSACHTTTSRDFTLLDESINLATGVQLAGFPSVIGTLWQVADEPSADIARELYQWMLGENPGEGFDTRKSAAGLHRAVRRLRDTRRDCRFQRSRGSSDPLIWAPYIHLGI